MLLTRFRCCLFVALILGGAAEAVFAQTATLTFRPGPGANDGTDEGGAAAGKDTFDLRNEDPATANSNNRAAPMQHHFNSNCNVWNGRSYYQFDVSSLPTADVVTNVELVLHQRVGASFGYQLASTTMVVQAITTPWNEMTETFNFRPTVSPDVEASVTYPTVVGGNPAFEGSVSLDITELYKDWRDGTSPNYGFAYSRPQLICENTNYNFTGSSDNADETKRPALVITYSTGEPPPPPPPVCSGVTDNLVSCWAAENNALDSVGPNNGTLYNGANFAPGVVGNAFRFDGVNDYGRVPDSLSLDVTAQMTVAAWVKPEVNKGGGLVSKTVPLSAGWSPPYQAYGLYYSHWEHDVAFYMAYGGGVTYTAISTMDNSVPLNEWHHLAGTFDGYVMRVYVDGVLQNSRAVPGPITPTSGHLYFGTQREDRLSATNETFGGRLDEIRLYNRALDECELLALAMNPCEPEDTTPPVITHPDSVTAEATSAAGAVVHYDASALDEVDGAVTVTCTPASGSTFALDHTQVTCSATDAAGNSVDSFFDVFVNDTTAPALAGVPADIVTQATSAAGAPVTYASPTATDLVDGVVAVNCAPASGSTFAVATTTVHCSASDAHGNAAGGSFTVTVQVTLEGLYALIDSFVDNQGIANALKVKLRTGALGAFRNQVAAQTGKALTAEEASVLLGLVGYL